MGYWNKYWHWKKNDSTHKGIDYTLSPLQEELLKERALKNGYTIGRKKGEYHLGRIDHSIGYTYDNVEWQSVEYNSREVHNRHNLSKNLEAGMSDEVRKKVIATQKKNDHFRKMNVARAIKMGSWSCEYCRRTKGRKGPCKNRIPVTQEERERYGLWNN